MKIIGDMRLSRFLKNDKSWPRCNQHLAAPKVRALFADQAIHKTVELAWKREVCR